MTTNIDTLTAQLMDAVSGATTPGVTTTPETGVVGTPGNDVIAGDPNANNVIVGNGGSDVLTAGGGNDVLVSGDPNTVATVPTPTTPATPTATPVEANGTVALTPDDGNDLFQGTVDGSETATYQGGAEGEVLKFSQSGEQVLFDRTSQTPFNANLGDFERFNFTGGVGNDSIEIGDLTATGMESVTSRLGGGDDVLNAAATNVAVSAFGGRGNDSITTGAGNDTIQGGLGNDNIVAGKGTDTVAGGQGNDGFTWNNGDGSDVFSGGRGYDTVVSNGNEGNEIYTAKAVDGKVSFDRLGDKPFNITADSTEEMSVNGLAGNDLLLVDKLSETGLRAFDFNGGEGNDFLIGTNSDVELNVEGGLGDDFIIGGTASDDLSGGAGNDRIFGGAGADNFIFETGNVFDAAEIGTDTIYGFEQGSDKIVLDQNTFAALQSQPGGHLGSEFAVVGSDAEAATSTALITAVVQNGSARLFYNSNGAEEGLGRGSEFATIAGVNQPLTAEDFVVQV